MDRFFSSLPSDDGALERWKETRWFQLKTNFSYLCALLKARCLAVNLLFGFKKLSVLSIAFSIKTSVDSVIFGGVTDGGLFRILFLRTNLLENETYLSIYSILNSTYTTIYILHMTIQERRK